DSGLGKIPLAGPRGPSARRHGPRARVLKHDHLPFEIPAWRPARNSGALARLSWRRCLPEINIKQYISEEKLEIPTKLCQLSIARCSFVRASRKENEKQTSSNAIRSLFNLRTPDIWLLESKAAPGPNTICPLVTFVVTISFKVGKPIFTSVRSSTLITKSLLI